jgi:hypothetical protein
VGVGVGATQTEVRHRFVCIDNAPDARLILVDQFNPSNSWTCPVSAAARSLQRVGEGRVLVGSDTGFAEHDLATGEAPVRVGGYQRISAAVRRPDGTTWLAAHSPSGVVVHVVGCDLRPLGAGRLVHPDASALRVIQVLDNGHLLMSVVKPFRAVEIDLESKVVWSVVLDAYGDKGYEVCRLADGTTLASTGGGAKVVQVDCGGRLLRFWGDQKKGLRPGLGLDFISGFERLASGNVVVANWLGHGKHGTGPHLVEFDAANEVVWQWADHAAARQVTNVLMLE